MERTDATGKWDPPFTSWPSSKAKRRKNCLPHSRTVSFSLFRPERHRHFLILRCLALIRCLFFFGHLIWQAIQSTFDISRPQHHRPVCNWPIRFCCATWPRPSGNCRSARRIFLPIRTRLLRAHRSQPTTDDPLDLGLDF